MSDYGIGYEKGAQFNFAYFCILCTYSFIHASEFVFVFGEIVSTAQTSSSTYQIIANPIPVFPELHSTTFIDPNP